ncbi:MAG TPA: tRNA (adenosine(37)-N6)-threonylcarbamoyltransferase complex ATPase subunit type 1 TsaE [Candidatus Paceibacterota bacterium]|nr:tRNA (adenosine(37)-N6)-threonylcarbamoyltransferase complex ATPase subunit type 1 TsaE [Candidatus Paceibacterota bacterium]
MIKGHEYTIDSLNALDDFVAHEFLPFLTPSDDGATVIALTGDLGSGKTAFVKSVAKQFGITDHIVSPTFIIAKFYPLPGSEKPEELFENAQEERAHPHFHELVHIDAYRMEDPKEAEVLRLPELLNDERKIIFIEWPEQLGAELPKGNITLQFKFVDETTRTITQTN